MVEGHFYYIKKQYFLDFPDPMLMNNKETINGQPHGRPCFYAFTHTNSELFWMIPISSQVSKYRTYYNEKLSKYKKCDTIVFGNVLGKERAFLIQNMCPVTLPYINNEYVYGKANTPVRVDGILERNLRDKAKRVLTLQRKGTKLIFPDVLDIEAKLIESLNRE